MPEPTTVDALLRHRADDTPDKDCVVDPDTRLTYRELDTSTRDLAARLIEAGVTKGTRVGLLAPNSVAWVQTAFAVTRVGAVLVPLSTLLRPEELTAQVHTASVQHLITVEQFRGRHHLTQAQTIASTEHGPLEHVWDAAQLDSLPAARVSAEFVDALAATVRPADPLVVIFTSGSSGAPKGVLHSHGSALGAVRAGLAARCVTAVSRLYLPMPFFWVGGFSAGVLASLAAGATLITESVSSPDTTLPLVERERVTLFRGWSDQAEALARRADSVGADLSSLGPGSLEALLPPELRAPPGARANLFGMTESFGPYSGFRADTDMPRTAWGSCGQPFPGMEVRIVDPDTGDLMPTGETGMIQIRGPHILRGICRRDRHDVFTADGFYPTGDLGHLDADCFLFQHGRSDDMFKVSGATVYPSEVEAALRGIPGVRAAFVTKVQVAQRNRVAAAVICEDPGIAAGVPDAVRARISSFKVPSVWRFLDDEDAVPRKASGKVDMTRLRELFS
ncbi:class I adenylate-forming enzyme family protein [Mycolicibacterium confluentis]|uniref:AMP-binding protein n=1 Tax=Mycolicibacterium confluentis TaxID=28047 RepID=A0A7I7XQX5_9MYCO|nr:class I adenylate-forming enzyme family protein [Mycolicibacterium confluentis]MCV7321005.1 acyl--CoA ligase [Mycolicibacterium confluentis]ORV25899.1 AMP-binding protein [Mycolicibacterium confluentis]BBZ31629.1 AMP-binding protein [Mycolicibacterium confluentis]